MAKFISTSKTATLIADHALEAFGLDNFEQINIKSENWGVMVQVLVGEHKGFYDYNAQDHSFIAA